MQSKKEVYEYWKANGIYRTMGNYLMSAAAVRCMVRTQMDREQKFGELSTLRTVTANALKRAGINNKAELLSFYETEGAQKLLSLRNIGEKGLEEIKDLLGLKEEQINE